MSGIIYHLFCTVTGKAYVGQTWDGLEERWKRHLISDHCQHLKAAIQKHCIDAFVRSVLTQGLTIQADMDAAEKYWIEYFDTIKNGYNIREGGSRGQHSEQTKARIGAANRGRRLPRSPEHSAKIAASHRGLKYRPRSAEYRAKMALLGGGRPFVDQNGIRYLTLGEAATALRLNRQNISAVLHGRLRSTGGYVFRYAE